MISAHLDNLATADGSGVRVAIVDTGVDPSHDWIGQRLIASYSVEVRDDLDECRVVESDHEDLVGHGTACAGQVARFAPRAEIISIRILDANRSGSSMALVSAMRWLKEQRVDVVNMSLSTMREQLALLIGHATDDLHAAGIPCICARGYHATGRDYPASFAGSIGVTHTHSDAAELRFQEKDLVEFAAHGIDCKVAWRNGLTINATGSSYACPLVSGLVARMLSKAGSMAPFEIKTALKAYASRTSRGWRESWMEEVAINPSTSISTM